MAFHLSGAGKLGDARRDEADKADNADGTGDDRGKRNRDANGSNARALDRQAKSASAAIAKFHECQRPRHQQGRAREDGDFREKGKRNSPALLRQRSRPPDEQAGKVAIIHQDENGGQRAAPYADDQAGKHERQGREAPSCADQENDCRRGGAAEQGNGVAAEALKGGKGEHDGNERKIGACGNAKCGGRGERIAQHLLQQASRERKCGTGQQGGDDPRQGRIDEQQALRIVACFLLE